MNPERKKYSFESFVTGESNRFAYAAARAVAESPGQIYNPLIFTGGTGLGKTHLMHAIEQYILEYDPEKKVKYVISDTFVAEMIQAIRREQMEGFREQYRSLDVLLIDDIQFLNGKVSTQAEIVRIMEELYQMGKQIVFSSGESLDILGVLKEKILAGMEDALVAEIGTADYEMRLQILKKELERYDLDENSRKIVLEYVPELAWQVPDNIGRMKGALSREVLMLKLSLPGELN